MEMGVRPRKSEQVSTGETRLRNWKCHVLLRFFPILKRDCLLLLKLNQSTWAQEQGVHLRAVVDEPDGKTQEEPAHGWWEAQPLSTLSSHQASSLAQPFRKKLEGFSLRKKTTCMKKRQKREIDTWRSSSKKSWGTQSSYKVFFSWPHPSVT